MDVPAQIRLSPQFVLFAILFTTGSPSQTWPWINSAVVLHFIELFTLPSEGKSVFYGERICFMKYLSYVVYCMLQGYRTGYPYKQPVIKREVLRQKSNSEVEVPPSSSSFTYVFDGDLEHSKYV